MAVGGCAVAAVLLSFACFHSADAARDFRAKSSRSRKRHGGCEVPSHPSGRILTFTSEDKIGAGAQGDVYKATDQNGNHAAVKLMSEADQKKEFKSLQMLSEVRSRHINNLEADFQDVTRCCGQYEDFPEQPCVVIELIDGQDLKTFFFPESESGLHTTYDLQDQDKRANSLGKLSYQLLRSIMFQSLTGFRDTEKAGLCNPDQHLGNIMITTGEKAERIVFVDFGHANSRQHPKQTWKCPPPQTNFFPDIPGTKLQSFRSLAFLLANDTDRDAYRALCEEFAKGKQGKYDTAEAALNGEENATDSSTFFNLHPDDIISKQREALKETGSPYIGPVSGQELVKVDVTNGQPVPEQALSLGSSL